MFWTGALFWTRRFLPVRPQIYFIMRRLRLHATSRRLTIAIAGAHGADRRRQRDAAGARRHPAMPGRPECRLRRRLGDSLECVFQSEGRRPEPYIATVRRFGVDLGFTEQTQLSWAVNAPNSRLGRGELAGSYGGVGANASIGVGGGGNFLVGGPANPTRCSRSACRARPGSTSPPVSPASSWSRSAVTVRAGTASPASPSRLSS